MFLIPRLPEKVMVDAVVNILLWKAFAVFTILLLEAVVFGPGIERNEMVLVALLF